MNPNKIKFISISFIFLLSINSIFAQTWTDKSEDESYVARHESGFVQVGNKFFSFGGRESSSQIDIYDYTTNTWSIGGTAPVEFNHFQAVAYEGLIWVIGAFKTNSPNPEQNADYIYMYNPASEQWIQGMEIPNLRKRGSAGLALYNNKFYLVGGNNNGHSGGYVPFFDEFNPQIGVWTELTDAPRPRDHFQAAVINDKLYAIAGRLTGGTGGLFEPQVLEVDVYDFNTSSWSTLNTSSNIPYPRSGLATVVFNDEIYTIGGETTFNRVGNGQVDVVESFNPLTNTWTTRNSLNYRRHGIQAIVSGDGIHLAGGAEGGNSMKNMEYYATDNPSGNPNLNSVLLPDETTKTFTYEESDGVVNVDIILSNTIGTTGIYIDTIVISGANYTLSESYNNRLLGVNSNLTITALLSDTTSEESNGTITVTYNNNSTLIINLEGELDNTLSLIHENQKNYFTIYPSPVKESFEINKSVSNIKIFDLSGKLIKEFKGGFEKGYKFIIEELPSNLYIVTAENFINKQLINSRFIKE